MNRTTKVIQRGTTHPLWCVASQDTQWCLGWILLVVVWSFATWSAISLLSCYTVQGSSFATQRHHVCRCCNKPYVCCVEKRKSVDRLFCFESPPWEFQSGGFGHWKQRPYLQAILPRANCLLLVSSCTFPTWLPQRGIALHFVFIHLLGGLIQLYKSRQRFKY